MLRMEIALFLVIIFLAYAYFSAEEKGTFLHKLFSVIFTRLFKELKLLWRYNFDNRNWKPKRKTERKRRIRIMN